MRGRGLGLAIWDQPIRLLLFATLPLSALGLVVNMIVLWNTLYMDAVLNQLRAEGYTVRPEDEARLSAFGHEHINMLGRYSFQVPEAVARGELRPLQSTIET
jgi:hypothetical protein